jgi:hypothetical protein
MTKHALRLEAIDLRKEGCSVPDIARRLGVAKSTAFLWTKDMPLDPTPEHAEVRMQRHMEHMREVRWEPHRRERDARRAAIAQANAERVGDLSDREVLLLGAVAYWCEGQKAKPWQPNRCRLQFINSDTVLVALFLNFTRLLGIDSSSLGYRLSIHEKADVEEASRWWADAVGVPVGRFDRPTLKTHNPLTVRSNVGDSYHGCLVITVLQSRQHYWRVEGLMHGIAGAVGWTEGGNM